MTICLINKNFVFVSGYGLSTSTSLMFSVETKLILPVWENKIEQMNNSHATLSKMMY